MKKKNIVFIPKRLRSWNVSTSGRRTCQEHYCEDIRMEIYLLCRFIDRGEKILSGGVESEKKIGGSHTNCNTEEPCNKASANKEIPPITK